MASDGGPAFPYQPGEFAQDNTGMSLRDWFAGQAVAGGLTGTLWPHKGDHGHIAEHAYAIADAMLAEREKEKV